MKADTYGVGGASLMWILNHIRHSLTHNPRARAYKRKEQFHSSNMSMRCLKVFPWHAELATCKPIPESASLLHGRLLYPLAPAAARSSLVGKKLVQHRSLKVAV